MMSHLITSVCVSVCVCVCACACVFLCVSVDLCQLVAPRSVCTAVASPRTAASVREAGVATTAPAVSSQSHSHSPYTPWPDILHSAFSTQRSYSCNQDRGAVPNSRSCYYSHSLWRRPCDTACKLSLAVVNLTIEL